MILIFILKITHFSYNVKGIFFEYFSLSMLLDDTIKISIVPATIG